MVSRTGYYGEAQGIQPLTSPRMASSKTKAPEQTFEEPKYLRRLADTRAARARKTLRQPGIEGRVEFYDEHFIRLTRDGEPNLFLYKHDIKYLYEFPDGANPRNCSRHRARSRRLAE